MSIDFTQKQSPEGPVLVLDHVDVPLLPAYDTGMSDVSLSVHRGELVLIKLERGVSEHPLVDVISGLVTPDKGDVRVFGCNWKELHADQQAKARWRIGRVFGGHGWMSNLDVDENITLSERHHTSRGISEIMDEAQQLAALVGLPGIPEGRPSVVERNLLRRAEWVRSALGTPWLILMELPGRELSRGWMDNLKPLVRQVREQGTAVIWFGEDSYEWNDADLNPSLKLYAEANKLIREG